jgi:tetratricopeptide (TPR) repeat protein
MSQTLSPQELLTEGQTLYRAGDYQAAAQAFAAAENGFRFAEDPLSAAEMANNRSVALLKAGDAREAFLAVDGTQVTFEAAGDQRRWALALGNRAAALEASGRLDEAALDYQKSADLLKELGEHELRATVLQSLSTIQLRTRKPLQALATMQAGIENIKHPNLRQRILKRLLQVPFKMLE